MIKRDDLAKQFELLTKQEIKNYKDEISSVYGKLDLVLSNLENTQKESLLNHHKNESEIKKLAIQIEIISKELGNIAKVSSSAKSDIKCSSENQDLELKKIHEEIKFIKSMQDGLSKRFNESEKVNRAMKKDLTSYVHGLNSIIESFYIKINQAVDEKINNLRHEPRESDKQINYIIEKLNVDRVDFDGLMKEVKILKRDNQIKEKNIEKLYILIERLEKKQ